MCTIPYDKGWKVRIDGATKEAETVLGNYLLIPVEPGTHEIVLEFVPQGLAVGAAVTAAAGVLLLISIVIRKKKSTAEECCGTTRDGKGKDGDGKAEKATI